MPIVNKSLIHREYTSRINRVLDYIDNHLADEMSLIELSSIANFSPYHFSRIFKGLMGKTIFGFIHRLRLEKAAQTLCMQSEKTINEIAYDCGFSLPSSFAKAFKDCYNVSATEFRDTAVTNSNLEKLKSNLRQANRKQSKDIDFETDYFCTVTNVNFTKQIWSIEMNNSNLKADVRIENLPEFNLAYIRHIGPYAGDSQLFERLFTKLFSWAGPRGLIRFPETKTICINHDNPEITEPEKLRTSCCITVPTDTKTDGEIGNMTLPAGKYAIAHFEITNDQFGEAWNMIYGSWLPQSGYIPDDRPCFEMYLNDKNQHPEGKFIVDICIPVK